jgi:DNA-binding MarR family transcriptional regulator
MSLMRDLMAVDDQASDLPLRQLRVCAMLYEGPRSMSSLSRELGVSLSAMTQIADRLERARLVKRSFEGTDRRVRSLQLTPRAQKIMQLREDSRVERASAALQQLPIDQRTNVLKALRSLQDACAATKTDGTSDGSNHNANSNHNDNNNGKSHLNGANHDHTSHSAINQQNGNHKNGSQKNGIHKHNLHANGTNGSTNGKNSL